MTLTEQTIQDLLARRRDAAIKIILRAKENECDVYLPVEASTRLRKVVLDQLNEYHTLAMDLLAAHDGFVVNQLWLDRMEDLQVETHRSIEGLRRELVVGRAV